MRSGAAFLATDNEPCVRNDRQRQILPTLPTVTNNAHHQVNAGLRGNATHGVNITTDLSHHLVQSHGTLASLDHHSINDTLVEMRNAEITSGRSVASDPVIGRNLFQGPHPTPFQNVPVRATSHGRSHLLPILTKSTSKVSCLSSTPCSLTKIPHRGWLYTWPRS